jgi:zinc transporter 1/2/3
VCPHVSRCALRFITGVPDISTSYVDHIYAFGDPDAAHTGHTHSHAFPSDFYSATPAPPPANPTSAPSATTPLLAGAPVPTRAPSHAHSRESSYPSRAPTHAHSRESSFLPGHHRHEPRELHSSHYRTLPRAAGTLWALADGAGPALRARGFGERASGDVEGAGAEDGTRHVEQQMEHVQVDDEIAAHGGVSERAEALSRKRQVIQILVCGRGAGTRVCAHRACRCCNWASWSTRSSSGSHSPSRPVPTSVSAHPLRRTRPALIVASASLLVAVCFHQLFEGLSLGIRIAGLPVASHAHGTKPAHGGHPLLRPVLALLFAVVRRRSAHVRWSADARPRPSRPGSQSACSRSGGTASSLAVRPSASASSSPN